MKRIYIKQTAQETNKTVTVAGWIDSRRDHGKLTFFDLRDKSGILQVVVTPKQKEAHAIAQDARPEWIIEIEGTVKERPESMQNKDLKTGNIELVAEKITILSKAKTHVIGIEGDGYNIDEEKRLEYRYLDLKRQRLQKNLRKRHEVIQFMRNYLSKDDFIEIETPLLTKSTPEGSRDFLVPSRLQPGKFWALPQSPQQYKQLLQIAGFEKYFQIARALRDEDPRADRQAEHTQLDIEMSFVTQEDVMLLIENLYINLIKELFPEKKVKKTPFPVMTYKEAMKKYKSDKPDLRTKKDELAFVFIVDFPAFEKKGGRWDATHNPFSSLQTNDLKEVKKNPGKVLAFQYDLVLNGQEIAGGSIRASNPEALKTTFEVMGYKESEIKEQFGHMLKAFEFGAPPHGGIASGIDRFLAIMLNEPNIREVIAFPKTGDNRELMMDSPDKVSKEQLKELHLTVTKKK